MKNTNHIHLLLSSILLALGVIGFAVSPLMFDLRISEFQNTISEHENYRQLASRNLYDSMDWWRYAGITANNITVLSELDADSSIINTKKTDYINESKFSLNSLYIAIQSAKGEFNINEEELWKKWDGKTEPDEFFKLQKEYSTLAMSEIERLELTINNNKNKISSLEIYRKWFWIICILLQSIGMFFGIYHTQLKEKALSKSHVS